MSGGIAGSHAAAWTPTGAQAPIGPEIGFDFQNSPFSWILVDRLVRGGTRVSWALEPTFGEPSPWEFQLQWARSGNDSWTAVTSVYDTYAATDPTRRAYSELLEGFYRVVLIDDDGSSWASKPTNFPTTWELYDLQHCNELRRREELLYTRGGAKCWFLLRRNWGTDCTACKDLTTGEVKNPRCSICFGTGFVGGYYAPHPASCVILRTKEEIRKVMGTTVYQQQVIRVAPIPAISEHDVIILDGSDIRSEVETVVNTFEIKGRPIIQHLQLRALDPGSAVYDITWSGSDDPTDGEQDTW